MLRRSKDATLMEKFKEHYQNRNIVERAEKITKSTSWFSQMTTLGLIVSIFLEALVILLPALYTERGDEGQLITKTGYLGEGFWTSLVVLIFLLNEVAWNWWRTYYDVPNWVTQETKTKYFGPISETPAGWRHCPTCQLDAPPRSYHCSLCNHCILKRDHHCYFTGSCVGYYNQRHFISFLSYCVCGLFMSVYFELSYLSMDLPFVENFVQYIPPIPLFQFLAGNLSLWSLLLMLHVYMNLFFAGFAIVTIAWQLFLIARGQTSYEAWKNIKVYGQGIYGNFTSVFGSPTVAWILIFAPLMLPLDSDGVKWKLRVKSEKGY